MSIINLPRRVAAMVRWPFTSPLAAPLWLGLRIYLGSIWLQFGLTKIRTGWLTENPMQEILSLVARGLTPTPLPVYRRVAELLLAIDMDRVMSVVIPLLELGFAVAFFAGVLLVPAAAAACLLNVNLVLSGIATWDFDGRVIALQLLLLLAWRVAGYLGIGASLRELFRSYRALLPLATSRGPAGRAQAQSHAGLPGVYSWQSGRVPRFRERGGGGAVADGARSRLDGGSAALSAGVTRAGSRTQKRGPGVVGARASGSRMAQARSFASVRGATCSRKLAIASSSARLSCRMLAHSFCPRTFAIAIAVR